ncbi:hypothetical protein [Pseudolactococcus insecticola]|uniref:Phage protein n=1 Tax=Pseudolactococcus insecticola TaxID=2709158 RepID=A0A6A0B3F1_9LACT|nr:hypothetical protein [Lactococcus insecticola]GFH39850.1 hypothetical protein Hs20B_02480 [Lactococcus insecticola]
MSFSKEIKGKTVMFTKGARFFEKLGKLSKASAKDSEGASVEIEAPAMAIESLKNLSGEVDRDEIVFLMSKVAYAMQVQLSRDEFIDYLEDLDNSDLIELTQKVKSELETEKKLTLI